MSDFEVWSVFWFLCVMCVAPVKIHCQWVKVYGVCVIPWQQADTVRGFQQWQDRCWQGTKHVHYRWCVAYRHVSCWCCQRARHSLGSPQNCPGPAGLQRSVCTLGAEESHRWWQISLYGTVWAFSYTHLTCYTDQRGKFWSWNMVNYTKPETRKRMCDRETFICLQQRKWNHFHP